jgi:hypothetical protein
MHRMLNIRRDKHMRGKQKCRKNCGVQMLPKMLWGSKRLSWGNHARAALGDVLPVDQRHRAAEARRTRAEQGGTRLVRTRDLRMMMRCENEMKHVQYQGADER